MIITDATSCCNETRGAVAPRGAPAGVRAATGPLGIVTRNSSPQDPRALQADGCDPETGEILTPNPQLARANRWALKSVVNKLLPGSRTSKCMVLRAPVPGHGLADIDLCMGQTHKKAFYQGLMACGGVWTCPVCAAKISERRRVELQDAIKAAKALDMRVHFVTLTIPHGIGDDIQELLDKLAAALKRLSSGKHSLKGQLKSLHDLLEVETPKIHGYIRALEVTHGVNGFHPHFHILVFTDRDLHTNVLHPLYLNAWKRACRLSGLPEPSDEHGVKVEDGSKAAKYASKWGLEDEMTKAQAKTSKTDGLSPWGMLRAVLDGDNPDYPPARASKLFQVYANAFQGRRQLFWSVGLRKLLSVAQELSDEELVAKPEDERASVLASLTSDQWRSIRRSRQEAHLLTVAESAPDLLPGIIRQLVQRHVASPPRQPSG